MDLARTVYSRDLKIAAMRALDAGATAGETGDRRSFPQLASSQNMASSTEPHPSTIPTPGHSPIRPLSYWGAVGTGER
jgi:hypothetical protein